MQNINDEHPGYGEYRLGHKSAFAAIEKNLEALWSDSEVVELAQKAKDSLEYKEPYVRHYSFNNEPISHVSGSTVRNTSPTEEDTADPEISDDILG